MVTSLFSLTHGKGNFPKKAYYNLPRYVGFPSEMMVTKRYDMISRGPTLWLFNSSPWFFDGP